MSSPLDTSPQEGENAQLLQEEESQSEKNAVNEDTENDKNVSQNSSVIFSVDNIKQAIADKEGIYVNKEDVPLAEGETEPSPDTYVDTNFAQAIYDSIYNQSDKFLNGQTLESNTYANLEELLANFNGVLNGSGKGDDSKKIKSIKGISFLKSLSSLDLRYNEITDLTPLAGTGMLHYGTVGHNMVVMLSDENFNPDEPGLTTKDREYRGGNPFYRFPESLGGRFRFEPHPGSLFISLANQAYAFICDDGNGMKTTTIPIDIRYNGNVADLMEGATSLYPSGDGIIGAKIADGAQLDGTITGLPLENIKGTGNLTLYLAMKDEIHYINVVDGIPVDSPSPQRFSPKFELPIKIEMYTKLEKASIEQTQTVKLSKFGSDDNQLKPGAEYSLYKEGEEGVIKKGLVTGEDGAISVPITTGPGKYYFEETKAPNGYEIPENNRIEFTVAEGKLTISGGNENEGKQNELETKDENGNLVTQTIDGTFMLSGSESYPIDLGVELPDGVKLQSISLEWVQGNQGGEAGFSKIEAQGDSKEAVETALKEAETQIKRCRDMYQNVKISASFIQNIEVKQDDPLKSIFVGLEAAKKLSYGNGKDVTRIPEGVFTFILENDPDYPMEPDIGTIEATNGGASQKEVSFASFEVGGEITKDTPKDTDGNYVYHYIIRERDNGDPSYAYDREAVKAEVTIGKRKDSDELEIKKIKYKKGETESNEFANTLLALPFSFTKVDMENSSLALSGAEFDLYSCNNKSEGHTHDKTVTPDTTGCWEILQSAVSDENGLVDFGQLMAGEYILIETKAPTGYERPLGQWHIQVVVYDDGYGYIVPLAAGGTNPPAFKKEGDMEGNIKLELGNRKVVKLPLTGGNGMQYLWSIGIGFIFSAALLWKKGRNPKQKLDR